MSTAKNAKTDVNGPLLRPMDNLDEITVQETAREEQQELAECMEDMCSERCPPPPLAEGDSDALQDTLRRLETAIRLAAPAQEKEWTENTLHELGELQEHLGPSTSDEGAEKFLEAFNLGPGLIQRGLRLLQEREDLLLQARMLLILLTHEVADANGDFSLLRRRIELLLGRLRRQESLEKELIFESLYQDVGTGD